MRYDEWMLEHGKRHGYIVSLLAGKSESEIIGYFDYENMRIRHPDFCPLYKKGIKCHPIEKLNCYMCACVFFRFNDNGIDKVGGKKRYSLCSINARRSKEIIYDNSIHMDCSECDIPHRRSVIKKYFDRDWFHMMKNCRDGD